MAGPFNYRKRGRMGREAAPVCDITIIGPNNRIPIEALIDHGTSVTRVPYWIIDSLSLEHQGEHPVHNAENGNTEETEIYIGNIDFMGTVYQNFPLYRWDTDRDFVLIGRDILKKHIANLDGPRQEFSLV